MNPERSSMSILSAIFELIAGLGENRWTESLSRDYRDDPVYKKKLEELIERNKKFEEARNRSNDSR